MPSRRHARIIALQCLFANEFLSEDPQSVCEKVCNSLEEEIVKFAAQLIQKAYENEKQISKLIKEHLRNWEYERVSILDRVLIKIAVTEMLFFPDIPVEVSINEALEISKEFCNMKSRRFVNGMLDSIYKKLKKTHQLKKNISVKVNSVEKNNSQRKGD